MASTFMLKAVNWVDGDGEVTLETVDNFTVGHVPGAGDRVRLSLTTRDGDVARRMARYQFGLLTAVFSSAGTADSYMSWDVTVIEVDDSPVHDTRPDIVVDFFSNSPPHVSPGADR